MREFDAYEDGKKSEQAGYGIDLNPCEPRSVNWSLWRAGWRSARDERPQTAAKGEGADAARQENSHE